MKAETIIKKLVDDDDALIKFIPGATQANYVVDRCCIIFGAKRDRCRYRTYQLSRGGVHREYRTQDSGTSRIQMARLPRSRSPLAPRRITMRNEPEKISPNRDGYLLFPDRKRYTLFEEGN